MTRSKAFHRPEALFLTPFAPDARGIGPAQRACQWVCELAATHEVHVLVIHRRGRIAMRHQEDNRDLPAASYRELSPTPRRWHYYWQVLQRRWRQLALNPPERLARRRPDWVLLTAAARRQLTEWFAGKRFNRMVCFRLQTGDYGRFFIKGGQVSPADAELDIDDLESDTRLRIAGLLARRGRFWAAFRMRVDARRTLDAERQVLPQFGTVWVCSPEDAARLETRRLAARVQALPNRIPALPPPPPPASPKHILFVGTLGYFPNEDAALFFAEEVLPGLRAEDPAWTFLVAGRGAPATLARRLARCPGVDFRGAVAEVAELYRNSGLVVAPLRGGGGTKIKVLEGLAHGRPVIATAHATFGLGLADGVHFVRAETGPEWVAACRRVAGNPELAARLGAAGRERMRQDFIYAAPPSGAERTKA